MGTGELLSGNESITNVMGWAVYNILMLLFMGYFYFEDIRKGKSETE